jgi:hypothetical protein
MQNKSCAFTSINAYYLPKAIALGRSVVRENPNIDFYILLAERDVKYNYVKLKKFLLKDGIHLISISKIGISDINQYIFQREIVEACTAVKGRALIYFQSIYDKVIYLDPDIVVFNSLNPIIERLNSSDIILIPHQNSPAEIEYGVDAEMTSLQFGVFNLGFVAVNSRPEAIKFSNWWANRLDKYCFDDRANGLFTDQKWCDLAPALFSNIYVERTPGFNVAVWNSHCYDLFIGYGSGEVFAMSNDHPLVFFHFSGLDSGEGLKSSQAMGNNGAVHRELYVWYVEHTNRIANEVKDFVVPWTYGFYYDGTKVEKIHRKICKKLLEIKKEVGDPYSESGKFYIQAHIGVLKKS